MIGGYTGADGKRHELVCERLRNASAYTYKKDLLIVKTSITKTRCRLLQIETQSQLFYLSSRYVIISAVLCYVARNGARRGTRIINGNEKMAYNQAF